MDACVPCLSLTWFGHTFFSSSLSHTRTSIWVCGGFATLSYDVWRMKRGPFQSFTSGRAARLSWGDSCAHGLFRLLFAAKWLLHMVSAHCGQWNLTLRRNKSLYVLGLFFCLQCLWLYLTAASVLAAICCEGTHWLRLLSATGTFRLIYGGNGAFCQ